MIFRVTYLPGCLYGPANPGDLSDLPGYLLDLSRTCKSGPLSGPVNLDLSPGLSMRAFLQAFQSDLSIRTCLDCQMNAGRCLCLYKGKMNSLIRSLDTGDYVTICPEHLRTC
jgi:hypothetical protein